MVDPIVDEAALRDVALHGGHAESGIKRHVGEHVQRGVEKAKRPNRRRNLMSKFRLGDTRRRGVMARLMASSQMVALPVAKAIAAEGKKVKMVYAIPTFQTPTNTEMSVSRRRQLLDLGIVALVQGLPPLRLVSGRATPLDVALLALRGALQHAILSGYRRRTPVAWLAPLADPLAVLALARGTLAPVRRWRGRQLS